jgi:hypothetical protein
MNNESRWSPWAPMSDPRLSDGVITTEDEYGRLIVSADCGLRCPGCGICCQGYHDALTVSDRGTQEFEMNLWAPEEELVPLDNDTYYQPVLCGPSCPGYGRCCPPLELRDLPSNLAEASEVLLEREDSQRWEIEAALMFLAHAGTVEAIQILEDYLPNAHAKVSMLAEIAWDEGMAFAPESFSSDRTELLKRESVLWSWEERLADRQYAIDEQIRPALKQHRYEVEVMQRVLGSVEDPEERALWEDELADLHEHIAELHRDLEYFKQEIELCKTMLLAIDLDIERFIDGESDIEASYDPPKSR